jgi:dienelactone hydrolase
VNIASRKKHLLMQAASIEQLRAIPGTGAFSVRADIGSGTQLYRIDARGAQTQIVVHQPTVGVGNADQSVRSALSDAPKMVGVLSYDWSPDGKRLWYAVLKKVARRQKPLFDEEIDGQVNVRRPPVDACVEYHLRSNDGKDHLVASRPLNDRVAFYLGGNISWAAGEVRYTIENAAPNRQSQFSSIGIDLNTMSPRKVPEPPANPFGAPILGPRGGLLKTVGFGAARVLIENMRDGSTHSYGSVSFSLGDPRSAGNWRSADGNAAFVGVRMINHPRYTLEWIDRRGRHLMSDADSFTKCDFATDLSLGVCIREGLSVAPELVLLRPRQSSTEKIIAISPNHSAITPLRVTPKIWKNKLGYFASGFITWPRRYVPGRRYPAIIITHGSDADERFARADVEWNYPAQVFAERGYLVLLINDPAPSQDATLSAAYDEWMSGDGAIGPHQLQQLLWLNGVYCFESAIDDLVNAGIIDPNRVGIAGYSRGSQMTNVTMTQSSRFRAASSGDGSYLEPYAYSSLSQSYDVIFGGSPYGPAIEQYRQLAPSLRASHVRGAILEQLAAPLGGAMDFYRALRAVGVPAQVTYYRGRDGFSDETHLFNVPSNRLLAMRENIAWFDFWLRKEKSIIMPFPDKYSAWAKMAAAQRYHATGP